MIYVKLLCFDFSKWCEVLVSFVVIWKLVCYWSLVHSICPCTFFSFLGTQPQINFSKFLAILFHLHIVGTMYAHESTYSFQATCLKMFAFWWDKNLQIWRFLMSGNYIINRITNTVGNSIVKLPHKHVM